MFISTSLAIPEIDPEVSTLVVKLAKHVCGEERSAWGRKNWTAYMLALLNPSIRSRGNVTAS